MRVVFMGYQTWGHRVLEALLESEHEVPLVITHPASNHAYETIWNDSVVALAERHGIPVLTRKYANDEEVAERLRELAPDLLVSSDWRSWVAPEIYALATYGAINIHDALLPRYGGFAPLNWALVNGEPEVGVTVHFMDENFDLGDIVVQKRVAVEDKDTVTDLFHKTIDLFAPAVLESLELIGSGRTDWTPQDPAQATFFHKRSVEDSRIDWTWPAQDLANLVRAQVDPYPNAFAYYKGERVRVLSASVSPMRLGGTVGRVFRPVGEGVAIVCGPGARRGSEYGLVVERVRTDDGVEHRGVDFFRTMGGYLTSRP
ncbi:methionyl-tRNA formyltransferase [Streptomyces sp. NPDC014861]|uniref:methionyl-tRNA formyltransferase n=1 Tax=Streptomyces sp. NPDC014861 TaxID=3364923 RepID=UPI0036FD2C44